mmetsp:Transcript_41853/g.120105  ORF Transcript_41853/g.120105 Transcript_41853/m.120105 type:complete len:427 (-) Transcript_41853:154-1434(-)
MEPFRSSTRLWILFRTWSCSTRSTMVQPNFWTWAMAFASLSLTAIATSKSNDSLPFLSSCSSKLVASLMASINSFSAFSLCSAWVALSTAASLPGSSASFASRRAASSASMVPESQAASSCLRTFSCFCLCRSFTSRSSTARRYSCGGRGTSRAAWTARCSAASSQSSSAFARSRRAAEACSRSCAGLLQLSASRLQASAFFSAAWSASGQSESPPRSLAASYCCIAFRRKTRAASRTRSSSSILSAVWYSLGTRPACLAAAIASSSAVTPPFLQAARSISRARPCSLSVFRRWTSSRRAWATCAILDSSRPAALAASRAASREALSRSRSASSTSSRAACLLRSSSVPTTTRRLRNASMPSPGSSSLSSPSKLGRDSAGSSSSSACPSSSSFEKVSLSHTLKRNLSPSAYMGITAVCSQVGDRLL